MSFTDLTQCCFLVCGGAYSAETGLLLSPLYPNHYEISRTCDYIIEAPLRKAIMLDFQDFDLEDNSYPSCDFDYLSVIRLMLECPKQANNNNNYI